MALTTQQKISLFEIIDTPYTGDVDEMYGKYGLSALTYEVSDSDKVRIKILDRIATLTSEEEDVLTTYIDRWEAIGTRTSTVDAGSIGATSGVTIGPNDERALLQRRVKNLVPVRHYWENVQQSAQESGAAGMSIQTVR